MTLAAGPDADLSYYRVISDDLLDAVRGPLAGLLAWRLADLSLRDVQLRRESKGARSWVSCYVGMTSVLDVDHGRKGFRLRAHPTHRATCRRAVTWGEWQTLGDLTRQWPAVLAYLDDVTTTVHVRWTKDEGSVHALLASAADTGLVVIDREASVSFRDIDVRDRRLGAWRRALTQALAGVDRVGTTWWDAVSSVPFGTAPDFLALDADGRLLVVEAKPASAGSGIVRAPAQVGLYATMHAAWLRETPDAAAVLEAQLAQRAALGLLPPGARTEPARPVTVVPVVAVGPGLVSPEVWSRFRHVAAAVASAHGDGDVADLEVLLLSARQQPTRWRTSDPEPVPRAEDRASSTYAERARHAAVAWRLSTLPAAADGPYRGTLYPFCLPVEQAKHNLLPEARGALRFFADRRIAWHAAVAGGPTNHLLSSQVQCVNALFPMVGDADRLKRAFARHLPIDEVLEVEPGAYLTFEHVGDADHLNEGSTMSRGAHRTSTDAAFAYRNQDGDVEIALVEWKYTEQYAGSRLSPDKRGVRELRYRAFWDDPQGPVLPREHGGPLDYADIFVEPFYQLVRQQMLAWRMESAGERGAQVVRVLHIAPSANTAYATSLSRPAHHAAGSTVMEVWAQMLRRHDRFTSMDSAELLDETITSPAYCARYGHG